MLASWTRAVLVARFRAVGARAGGGAQRRLAPRTRAVVLAALPRARAVVLAAKGLFRPRPGRTGFARRCGARPVKISPRGAIAIGPFAGGTVERLLHPGAAWPVVVAMRRWGGPGAVSGAEGPLHPRAGRRAGTALRGTGAIKVARLRLIRPVAAGPGKGSFHPRPRAIIIAPLHLVRPGTISGSEGLLHPRARRRAVTALRWARAVEVSALGLVGPISGGPGKGFLRPRPRAIVITARAGVVRGAGCGLRIARCARRRDGRLGPRAGWASRLGWWLSRWHRQSGHGGGVVGQGWAGGRFTWRGGWPGRIGLGRGGDAHPIFAEFAEQRVGKGGLGETQHLGAAHVEAAIQVGGGVMLDHRDAGVVGENVLAAFRSQPLGDEDERELAAHPVQGLAAGDDQAGAQGEREQALGLGGRGGHGGRVGQRRSRRNGGSGGGGRVSASAGGRQAWRVGPRAAFGVRGACSHLRVRRMVEKRGQPDALQMLPRRPRVAPHSQPRQLREAPGRADSGTRGLLRRGRWLASGTMKILRWSAGSVLAVVCTVGSLVASGMIPKQKFAPWPGWWQVMRLACASSRSSV